MGRRLPIYVCLNLRSIKEKIGTRSRQSTAEWLPGDPSREQNKIDGWHTCAKAVKQYDETIVKNWKEEIDTLLVFAGLFSAVITAFLIDSYKWLQQDTNQLTVQILAEISSKLDSFSISNGFVNSTHPLTTTVPPTFRPSALAVLVNTLWFSSLVSALASAFMGILVKQWLREYMRPVAPSPVEAVTLRQFRYRGLKKWGVVEIISVIPLILEFSLVLFLVGLLELLWSLHHTVAGVLSALVAFTLIFYIMTTILPALPSNNCPYKSPQSLVFCNLLWRILPHKPSKYSASKRSWQEREMTPLLQGLMKRSTMEALLWIDKVFLDREVLESIGSCLSDLRTGYSDVAVQFVHRVMAYRAGCSVLALKENVLENQVEPGELEANVKHPLVNFRLRIGKHRAQRLRRILMESLVWQWSISAELINTTPVLTTIHEIMATTRALPEHQDCFDPGDGLPRRAIEIVSDILGRDPSANPIFNPVQNKALDVLSYLSYRTPPPTLQEVLSNMISAVRKAYANGNIPIFLATGSILTRVLGRWDIIGFQNPETHLDFMGLLSDMERYFDGCNRERVMYGDRRVGKWPRRMRTVISRFSLSEEDAQRLNGVLEALQRGEELGLVPR